MANIYDRIGGGRKPRVHITYEVETDGAQVLRELPFVVGVMGDFSGNPKQPLRPLAERKFVEINGENFDEVLEKTAPELNFRVKNTIEPDNDDLDLTLNFRKMADFEPAQIVSQVPALQKLMDTRNRLRDLMTKVDRSADLEKLLERVLQNETDLKTLSSELDASQPKE